MTAQQHTVARWSRMNDETCECGRGESTLLGLDGDRLVYRCTGGHIYRVVDLTRFKGGPQHG